MEERVQKIIANSGFCSRRKAEEYIESGQVKVNGKVVKLGDKADSSKDRISIQNKEIKIQRKYYILLHKPAKCVTTLHDPQGRKKVIDFIKEREVREVVKPVGRLDYMSEGALILTNDGDFANKITHPSFETYKLYRVVLATPLSLPHEEQIARGMKLDDGFTGKINVKIYNEERTIISLKIHIGKKRVIRRIFDSLGYKILQLIRVQIGNIHLDIEPGKYRRLTQSEIEYFEGRQKKAKKVEKEEIEDDRPRRVIRRQPRY